MKTHQLHSNEPSTAEAWRCAQYHGNDLKLDVPNSPILGRTEHHEAINARYLSKSLWWVWLSWEVSALKQWAFFFFFNKLQRLRFCFSIHRSTSTIQYLCGNYSHGYSFMNTLKLHQRINELPEKLAVTGNTRFIKFLMKSFILYYSEVLKDSFFLKYVLFLMISLLLTYVKSS